MTNQQSFETQPNENDKTVDIIQQEVEQLLAADDDLKSEVLSEKSGTVEVTTNKTDSSGCPFQFIPLAMGGQGRTHAVSEGSRRLIEEEVSLEDLHRMTDLFYEKAFQDQTLDKFIHSHDDPHGARFAKWIHQKLSGSQATNLL